MIRLRLPFPVTTNHYWKTYRGRHVISNKGKAFVEHVHWAVKQQLPRHKPLGDRLAIHVELYPPDLRRRDIDNYAGKSLYDAMQRAGVYLDDCQIRESHNYWRAPNDEPHCIVRLDRL